MAVEKEIRTPLKNMVVCTVITDDFGNKTIHKKSGKKEDDIPLNQFLQQVFDDDDHDEPEL